MVYQTVAKRRALASRSQKRTLAFADSLPHIATNMLDDAMLSKGSQYSTRCRPLRTGPIPRPVSPDGLPSRLHVASFGARTWGGQVCVVKSAAGAWCHARATAVGPPSMACFISWPMTTSHSLQSGLLGAHTTLHWSHPRKACNGASMA